MKVNLVTAAVRVIAGCAVLGLFVVSCSSQTGYPSHPSSLQPSSASSSAGLASGSVLGPLGTSSLPGCAQGYWKQAKHFDNWGCGLTPNTLVTNVFDVPACVNSEYTGATLLAGLTAFPGNRATIQGSAEILIQQAITGLLNACAVSGYPLGYAQIVADTNSALATCDRNTIVTEANRLESLNEGVCPLH